MNSGADTESFWDGWMPVAVAILAVGMGLWLAGYFGLFGLSGDYASKLADLGSGILSGGLVTAAFLWTDKRNQARHEAELLRLQLGVQADLTGLDLRGLHLEAISLAGKRLQYANLSGCSLEHASFVRADLSEADLSGASLQYAQMMSAILTGANLVGANLQGADLTSANLSAATCVGANFAEADLTDTNLEGVDLSGANLIGAKVSGPQVEKARLSATTQLPRKLTEKGVK